MSSRALADSAIAGFTVNEARLNEALERNPILVTALNPVIGYEKGAAIAKKAYAEGKPILEVAAKKTDLPADELQAAAGSARTDARRNQGWHERRRLMKPLQLAADGAQKRLVERLAGTRARSRPARALASAPHGSAERIRDCCTAAAGSAPAAVLIGVDRRGGQPASCSRSGPRTCATMPGRSPFPGAHRAH